MQALLASLIALVPTALAHGWFTLTSGGGFAFDIDEFGGGQLGDGTMDAYDNMYYLDVNGTRYDVAGNPPTWTMGGRQAEMAERVIAGLEVRRLVYVPASGGNYARYLDIVRNPTSLSTTASIRISGNLGSDGVTMVVGSSSGDLAFGPSDDWFATDDADATGDPSLAHVLQGPGAPVRASTASLRDLDQPTWIFDVTVPPGRSVAILTFAIQEGNRALAIAEARRLAALPADATIGIGAHLASVVNFATVPPCTGEGTACADPSGAAGICRSGGCCTGCWDGTRCQSAGSASACGAGGGACVDCDDADACTLDTCIASSGTCFHAGAAPGTPCDDGLFCTAGDACDGGGRCAPGTTPRCDDGSTCTVDACNESTRACSYTPVTSGCIIGGACHAAGTVDPSNPCRVCDPARSGSDWSIAIGTACGGASCSAGVLTRPPTCDELGTCVPGDTVPCPTGSCSSPTMCNAPCAFDDECGAAAFCDPSSGQCRPRFAPGTECARDRECAVGSVCSADGRCCDDPCDGTCESCALPGREGFCSPVPAGGDPDDECPLGECTEAGTCAGGDIDAGPTGDDAGTTTDSGSDGGFDAGTPDFATYGCCGVAAGAGSSLGWALALLVAIPIALRVRRRRTARSTRN